MRGLGPDLQLSFPLSAASAVRHNTGRKSRGGTSFKHFRGDDTFVSSVDDTFVSSVDDTFVSSVDDTFVSSVNTSTSLDVTRGTGAWVLLTKSLVVLNLTVKPMACVGCLKHSRKKYDFFFVSLLLCRNVLRRNCEEQFEMGRSCGKNGR